MQLKNQEQDNTKSSPYDLNENISNRNSQKHISETCNECNVPHNTDRNSSMNNNIDHEDNRYIEEKDNRIVHSADKLSRTEGNSAKKNQKETSNDIEFNTTTEGE